MILREKIKLDIKLYVQWCEFAAIRKHDIYSTLWRWKNSKFGTRIRTCIYTTNLKWWKNVPISVIFHFQYLENITSGLWTLSTTPEDLVRGRYNTGTTPSPSGRHSASTGGKRRTDGHVTVAGQQTCQPMLWLIAGCYNFIQCFTRRRAPVDFRDTS